MSWKTPMPDSERYSYDYFFLEYVCRLCWCTDGVIELTALTSKSIENNSTVAEKILDCVGIDVMKNTHPKKVCAKCLNEIEIFTEFKRFCQETDKKLHEILQKGSIHPKDDEKEVYSKANISNTTILKEENGVEFSNFELEDSLDDLFDDLPLSCEINPYVADKSLKKDKKKRAPNYCTFCHLNLETAENLTKHQLEFHGIDENGLYKCFGCEKTFKHPKKRLRHETEFCKELKFGYKCLICDRFLHKRKLLEVHMRNHRDNKVVDMPDILMCKKCSMTFENMELLKEHMICHQKDKQKKNWVCDTCGRVFTRRDYLGKHKLMHEGNKQHVCPHCDFRTIQRSSLTVHLRKHTGERPYPCDLCPHRCVTSSNLREHRKRHFGIKSFECKLCDKKFGYKISLEEHMSAIHERSEVHSCEQCGATYSRFRGLRRHLLVKHGKKVKKVKNDAVEIPNEMVQSQSGPIQTRNEMVQSQSEPIQIQNEMVQSQIGPIQTRNEMVQSQSGLIKSQNEMVQSHIGPIQIQNETVLVRNYSIEVQN